MNGSDVIKLILVMNGYDRNINIETWKDDEDPTLLWYCIQAQNSKRDEIDIEEPGLTATMHILFSELFGTAYNSVPDYIGMTVKDLLDDKYRNDIIRRNEEIQIYNKIYEELSKDLDRWSNENNPCIECKINDHSHWDSIHYNCELCHTHSCKTMIKFYDDLQTKLKEVNEEARKVFEQKVKNSILFSELKKSRN